MYIMRRLFCFIIIVTVIIMCVIKCEDNCDQLGILFYEDIGCSPVYQDGKKCPTKYECEDFTPNNETCLFRGRRYNVREVVNDNLTYETCYTDCLCNEPTGDERYSCFIVDCPEWFDSEVELGCYRKYDADNCCSTGSICPSKEEVEECEFDGHKYKEGEIFFPKESCMKCACQKGFKGKLEEPFCKRNLCSLQILNSDKLENYCAPAYLHQGGEQSLCCPNHWVCPSATEEIVILNQDLNSTSNLTCKFGSTILKFGECFQQTVHFYGLEKNVICACTLPPLATCKEI